jgi:hypothetical protein
VSRPERERELRSLARCFCHDYLVVWVCLW